MRGNEVIALIVAIGVTLFLLQNRRQLRALPRRWLFYTAFGVAVGGKVLTVAEDYLFGDILNLLEHFCFVGSTILLAVWCWRTFVARGEAT